MSSSPIHPCTNAVTHPMPVGAKRVRNYLTEPSSAPRVNVPPGGAAVTRTPTVSGELVSGGYTLSMRCPLYRASQPLGVALGQFGAAMPS
jgi:hypothetical protein